MSLASAPLPGFLGRPLAACRITTMRGMESLGILTSLHKIKKENKLIEDDVF